MSIGRAVLLGGVLVAAPAVAFAGAPPVTVGSKKFTESVVLGELAGWAMRSTGAEVGHRSELGGTRVVFEALVGGEVDVYPEYTGTIARELLAGRGLSSLGELRAALSELGVRMGEPLGFNNTYALGMLRPRAEALGVSRISDLARHPELRLGFTNEFMAREDGWPALRRRYGLPQEDVQGLDHDLAYRGLAAGALDVMDLYSTDAEIVVHDLAVLEDDARHFPRYDAVYLWRADLEDRAPEAVAALKALSGTIDADAMVDMNARAKVDRVPESVVAADFARRELGLEARGAPESAVSRMVRRGLEHLTLTGLSLAAAIAMAVPMGVAAARRPRAGQVLLAVVGVVQTIPSLALLVLFIPLLGIGGPPAVAALFLYSLLPIVRNTHAGLSGIPLPLRDAARALGLPAGARLRYIELPLATPAILAGIKTAAVINVGTATLGALVGAGGLGQPILTGIRLEDTSLILQGAVPAALLALAAQGVFEVLERVLVPRSLRS